MQGVDLVARGGPLARAARPQRHRQDDAAQHADRRDAPPRRPIALAGRDITALAPHERAAAGIGWVPQERNIFKSLTVDENLTAVARPGPWTPQRAYEMFPRLAERKANLGNQLSGGEQQMLAVARALVLNPKLLLLDEPLEGLAPIIVEELLRSIERLVRDEGLSAIIVEQNPSRSCRSRSDAIVLDRGAVVHAAPSAAAARRPRAARPLARGRPRVNAAPAAAQPPAPRSERR